MKTQIKASQTRFPTLTRAILHHLDRETLEDVARHGADAGFAGFTYYSDTIPFFKRHRADIIQLAKDMASDLGEDMLQMVADFGCLKNSKYTTAEVGEALFNPRTKEDSATYIQNAMAWFALEEIARELNPDL